MKNILYLHIDANNSINGGYSNIVRNTISILDKCKEQELCSYIAVAFTADNFNDSVFDGYDECFVLMHPSSFLKGDLYDFFCRRSIPCYLHVFWETQGFPESWSILNDCFDGYVASSFFLKDMIEESFDKKCFYLPYLIEEEYNPIDRSIKDKEVFTVLYMGQATKRKGFEDALTSFCIFSTDKEDVSMVMKYHKLSNHEIEPEILAKSIIASNSYGQYLPEVFLLEQELSRDDIRHLYGEADCLLFCSRGEGLGLPIIEANLTGMPVIYIDFSSSKEIGKICNNNIAVEHHMDIAHSMSQYGYSCTSEYAVPDIKSCVLALEDLYSQWKNNKKNYYNNHIEDCESMSKYFTMNNNLKFYKELFNE